MRRALIHAAGWLSLLLWSAAAAQPVGGPTPLVLPTPEGPKLNVPQIAPAQPPLMLDTVRPLQIPPSRAQPSLGLLPDDEAVEQPFWDEPLPEEPSPEAPEPGQAPRTLYLEHER